MQMAAGQTHQTQGATELDPRPALMQLNDQLTGKRISQSAFESRQAELLKGWTKQQLYFFVARSTSRRLITRGPRAPSESTHICCSSLGIRHPSSLAGWGQCHRFAMVVVGAGPRMRCGRRGERPYRGISLPDRKRCADMRESCNRAAKVTVVAGSRHERDRRSTRR
jgi:hypothetical protein